MHQSRSGLPAPHHGESACGGQCSFRNSRTPVHVCSIISTQGRIAADTDNAMLMTDVLYLIPVAIVLALMIAAFGAWMWLRTGRRDDDSAVIDDPDRIDEGRPISKAEAARSTSWLL